VAAAQKRGVMVMWLMSTAEASLFFGAVLRAALLLAV
jgi:hypothetical protein